MSDHKSNPKYEIDIAGKCMDCGKHWNSKYTTDTDAFGGVVEIKRDDNIDRDVQDRVGDLVLDVLKDLYPDMLWRRSKDYKDSSVITDLSNQTFHSESGYIFRLYVKANLTFEIDHPLVSNERLDGYSVCLTSEHVGREDFQWTRAGHGELETVLKDEIDDLVSSCVEEVFGVVDTLMDGIENYKRSDDG